jgi:DNA-binding transcriptional LysR family regulator
MTAPLMRRFRARHPRTGVLLREFSCAHGFLEHRLDVAIVRSPIDDERIDVHPVATEPRVFLLPPGHPLAGAEGLSLLDLQHEPFVVLDPRAPAARDYWAGREQRDGELPPIGAEAFTAQEYVQGVLHLRAVAIAVASLRSLSQEIAVIDAVDLPHNTIGVAVRAGERRPAVLDFVRMAERIVADRAALVPGSGAIRPPGPSPESAVVTAGLN